MSVASMSFMLLIYKYFTRKSYLSKTAVESAVFDSKRPRSRGLKVSNRSFSKLAFATGLQFPHAEASRRDKDRLLAFAAIEIGFIIPVSVLLGLFWASWPITGCIRVLYLVGLLFGA